MVRARRTDLRWAFAGCKPQAVDVLTALKDAGFLPEFCAMPPGLGPDDRTAIRTFCSSSNVPLHESEKLADFEDRLIRLDLLLVCRFSLLPPPVFNAPRLGAVNIHSSLLPRYRGVHPVSWAMINGDRETGISIHCIDTGMDEGDILVQRKVTIDDAYDLHDLTAALNRASAGAAVELFRAIEKTGDLPAACPQEGAACPAPRRAPEDGRIDWSKPARAVFNLMRALPPPLPPAFAFTPDGRTVSFRSATLVEETGHKGRPGTVGRKLSDNEVEIVCGDGGIIAAEVSPALQAGEVLV